MSERNPTTATRPTSARRHPLRWLERAFLGLMMTVVAFVIERKLLKSIREGGPSAKRKLEQDEERERRVSSGGTAVTGPAQGSESRDVR